MWTLQLELQYHIDKWLEESKKKEDHLFNGGYLTPPHLIFVFGFQTFKVISCRIKKLFIICDIINKTLQTLEIYVK